MIYCVRILALMFQVSSHLASFGHPMATKNCWDQCAQLWSPYSVEDLNGQLPLHGLQLAKATRIPPTQSAILMTCGPWQKVKYLPLILSCTCCHVTVLFHVHIPPSIIELKKVEDKIPETCLKIKTAMQWYFDGVGTNTLSQASSTEL